MAPPLPTSSRAGLEPKPEVYYGGVREELLPFMPTHPGRVLEIGCGEGNFSRRLKERGAAETWGVEIVESAGARARQALDHVLVGDISKIVDELPESYFDLVVCNDVLEHLYDPYSVLDRLKSRISASGVVVSSIPNIRYYPTFSQLLIRKKWEYEESGILDWTHVRFFTVRSIREMYERLGYEILRHEGVNPMPDRPRLYRLANFVLRGKLDDMKYSQFVTVARPVHRDPVLRRPGSQPR
jgi:SAM-dependent methyltransferase